MAEHWRPQSGHRASDQGLVDLPPQPSRRLPRWVALVALFAAGALTMALVFGLAGLLSNDAPEAALITAYDQGFAEGGRAAANQATAIAAGIARGVAAAERAAGNVGGAVIPAFSLTPFLAAAIPLGTLDAADLADCSGDLPAWMLALHAAIRPDPGDQEAGEEGAPARLPGLAILPPCR